MLQRYKQASECKKKQKEASFSLFCEFMGGLGSIHASSVCVGNNEKISNFSESEISMRLLMLSRYLTKFQVRQNSERRPVPTEASHSLFLVESLTENWTGIQLVKNEFDNSGQNYFVRMCSVARKLGRDAGVLNYLLEGEMSPNPDF
jgi:hypothetical protein